MSEEDSLKAVLLCCANASGTAETQRAQRRSQSEGQLKLAPTLLRDFAHALGLRLPVEETACRGGLRYEAAIVRGAQPEGCAARPQHR